MLFHCDRDQACHADVLLNALQYIQKVGPESGRFFCGSIREEAHQVEFIYDGQPTSWSTQRTLRRKTVTKAEKVGEGLERREEHTTWEEISPMLMVEGSAA